MYWSFKTQFSLGACIIPANSLPHINHSTIHLRFLRQGRGHHFIKLSVVTLQSGYKCSVINGPTLWTTDQIALVELDTQFVINYGHKDLCTAPFSFVRNLLHLAENRRSSQSVLQSGQAKWKTINHLGNMNLSSTLKTNNSLCDQLIPPGFVHYGFSGGLHSVEKNFTYNCQTIRI